MKSKRLEECAGLNRGEMVDKIERCWLAAGQMPGVQSIWFEIARGKGWENIFTNQMIK